MRFANRLYATVLSILFCAPLSAQFSSTASHIRYGATVPATCKAATGDVFFRTSTVIGMYQCLSDNNWTLITATIPAAITPTSIAVGGGTVITKILKGTIVGAIPSTVATSQPVETSFTITGAAIGDAIFITPRILLSDGSGPNNLAMLLYHISATDTVKVSLVYFTSGGSFAGCNVSCTMDYVLYK